MQTMIPAWTPNNSIFRDWARLVCTKLVMGWVRAHCGACHQSMGHHHGASSWGIYTDSWGIIIWSMSMHKRMQHATMQLAIAPLSVPRMSHYFGHYIGRFFHAGHQSIVTSMQPLRASSFGAWAWTQEECNHKVQRIIFFWAAAFIRASSIP